MEFLEAKAIAERLGFQLFADVRGDTNALRLFTEDFRQKYGKKFRCGVYMQFRADGSCYIGQSLDVDRRHKRHRELGVIVDYLAFRCWPLGVLMEKEDLCIQDALALGVPLVNKTLKCGTLKKSDDYDQIFTPDEQDLFIERIAARQTPLTQWPNFCKNAERSELRDWEIFSQHPRFMELYQKAAIYLKTTVPNPEETESVTWQCALCNEKSLQGAIRWVIKIRCGATVTFEIFHYSQAKYQYFVNIAVAPDLVYEAIDSQKPCQPVPPSPSPTAHAKGPSDQWRIQKGRYGRRRTERAGRVAHPTDRPSRHLESGDVDRAIRRTRECARRRRHCDRRSHGQHRLHANAARGVGRPQQSSRLQDALSLRPEVKRPDGTSTA